MACILSAMLRCEMRDAAAARPDHVLPGAPVMPVPDKIVEVVLAADADQTLAADEAATATAAGPGR
ncbi:hypothetical protein Mkiyose1088_30490 [Mycobacterium kiyosense]|nr:hypothetical protein NJB18091_12660 [Mycobacterium marinum]GLB87369.1 hypothetical protein SRL2020130_01860 [Mycobacterium kiyosense]GLB99581.1 hypothetical protein SRL2020400_01730 [Mycobacterium kiyosense]GLC11583.1 hypothetical protein SRL2020448_01860 [Mycobacterium kiyosense]GLD01183.1 hypothetical protein Mkiyose1088_30490 [Mycobacterium kiyosense]